MLRSIDRVLNIIPMYRITLYALLVIWGSAIVLGFAGMLAFSGAAIALSGLFLMLVSWLANEFFAWAFEVPVNHESAYITGLILALIISPAASAGGLAFLGFAAVIAMGSKYFITIGGKHMFNPAAFAVVVTSLAFGQSASWWVGAQVLFPVVAVCAFLLVRKISREDMVWSFISIALLFGIGFTWGQGSNVVQFLQQIVLSSSLVFFGGIMLTEPLTTPATQNLRVLYGLMMGVLFLPFLHIGSLYVSPELALILGNVFVYLVSPKFKLVLTLREKIRLSDDLYDFIFEPDRRFNFRAGQYLEWTLGDVAFNTKGNRRYFTIASAPSEEYVRVGVRMQEPISEFKKELLALQPGDTISASQLSGDFVLPKKSNTKLAFIAGGIGITPFRSMVKHLIDANDTRDTALVYSGRTPEDIVYRDVFDAARTQIGMKTIYTVSDPDAYRLGWRGHTGRITKDLIASEIPDYKERTFYVSGSPSLVASVKKVLSDLGVGDAFLKTDYFPGII